MTGFRPRCVLVTGGAGFIGSNFVRWVLKHDSDVAVINYDALTYAGNLESLTDVASRHGPEGDGRYYFVRGDIRDVDAVTDVLRGEARESTGGRTRARTAPAADAVVHLAAESHVDRSIMGPATFVDTNVRGTLVLLEACRGARLSDGGPFRFLHVSTDEVYGSLGPRDAAFTETTPLAPNSPYSASKAGSDLLVRSYVETFALPALITRCSNNYGPYQFPEKLIPLMIANALAGKPLPIYGDGMNVRDWLHVGDHGRGIQLVAESGTPGEIYNIGGGTELTNRELTERLLAEFGLDFAMVEPVEDRKGHDRRYSVDHTKITQQLGYVPQVDFETGLRETIAWYRQNRAWWEPLKERAAVAR